MTQQKPPVPAGDSEHDTTAATPERAPHESNYGYEADHPSYKLRNAGVWTPRPVPGKDHRPPGDSPSAMPVSGNSAPQKPGIKNRR